MERVETIDEGDFIFDAPENNYQESCVQDKTNYELRCYTVTKNKGDGTGSLTLIRSGKDLQALRNLPQENKKLPLKSGA